MPLIPVLNQQMQSVIAEMERAVMSLSTRFSDISQRASEQAAGAYYYLTKPYEKPILLAIVRSAIEGYALHRHMR